MRINNKVIILFLFINKEEKFKSSTLCNINNDYLCNENKRFI